MKAIHLTKWGRPVGLDEWHSALRWEIAKETGWTLEYIDELSLNDVWEYLSIKSGTAKKAR